MTKKLTIAIRSHISFEDIKSLLDSASRGASYWADQDLGFESETDLALSEQGTTVLDTEQMEERFVGGFWKKDVSKQYILNLKTIKKGLTLMAKKEPKHFADFIGGDYDQNTGDIFLQCCLFGEVIYA